MNETGREQARRNGRALAPFLPAIASARFIASPLARARETMEIMRAELGLPHAAYETDPGIVELSYGKWEGTLQDHVAEQDPEGWASRSADPFRWRPENGESYADLFERVRRWTDGLTGESVVVAHGGVSRCLRAHILGLDPACIPNLESPQDRVLILSQGEMHWL